MRKHILKSEAVPNCIANNEELLYLYNQTNLEFSYVFAKCKLLIPLKDLDPAKNSFSRQQVELWFIEFLKAGWTTERFDVCHQNLTRLKLYGERIDLADWFNDDKPIYGSKDIKAQVNKEIERVLQEGERLKAISNRIELTEEEKRIVAFYAEDAAKKAIRREIQEEKNELFELEKDKKKIRFRKIRNYIIKLQPEKRTILFKLCNDEGIFTGTEFEMKSFLKNLEDYCEVIPPKLLNEVYKMKLN